MFGLKDEKLVGMTAMLIGVASFSLMDACLKLLTARYSPFQVAALRGLAALPVVFAWALYSGGPRQLLRVRWPLHIVRGVMSVFMMVTFTYALQHLSLAKGYTIFFVAPMMITLLSIALLGERVGRPQWIAIGIGFTGVLIAAKPDNTSFGWWGTLAMLGTAVGYAVFAGDTAIRALADPTVQIAHWSEFDTGGHFPAMEQPDQLVDDIRLFFRDLR